MTNPLQHTAAALAAPDAKAAGDATARAGSRRSPLLDAIDTVTALPESLDRHAAIRAGYEYHEVITTMRRVAAVAFSSATKEHLLWEAAVLEREAAVRVLSIGRVRG